MRALERLPAPHGVAAMQSINVVVINLVFLSVFFGTGLVCAVLCVGAVCQLALNIGFFEVLCARRLDGFSCC
jgi:uncharacterized membrane protein